MRCPQGKRSASEADDPAGAGEGRAGSASDIDRQRAIRLGLTDGTKLTGTDDDFRLFFPFLRRGARADER
jgi:hypothetical protein